MSEESEPKHQNEMDENEIQSFGNIPSRDSENCYDNLTPRDVDSVSKLDDGLKEEENTKLHKSMSSVSSNSLNDEFSTSQTDSSQSTTDTSDANKDAENKELRNSYVTSKNKEDENRVFVPNTESQSVNNIQEENVNTGLVLTDEIALIEQSAVSSSVNQILTANGSGISSNDNKGIVFDEENRNAQSQSFTHINLPESDSVIQSDKINIVEIVPDDVNGEETYDAKPNSDILNMLLPRLSDNEEEQTIFNCDGQSQRTSLQGPFDRDETLKKVENKIDESKSAEVEILNLNSADNLIRSKSVAELSTVRTNKPSSLAEDAKLVKFSVSTKSVNIMQSNAQFLNKSRNFLNFITEKSTNIMEKTLLPQNLAAKYNSILNPANYKKFIEETGSSSDSVEIDSTLKSGSSVQNNCQLNDRIAYNVTKLDVQDTDTANFYNREQVERVSGNYSVQEDSMKGDRNLFLKCSVSENKSIHASILKGQGNGATSTVALSNKSSENSRPNLNPETPNMIDEEKISNSDFCSTVKDENVIKLSTTSDDSNLSDKISTAMPQGSTEVFHRDSNASSVGIDGEDSIEVNEIDDTVSNCENENNATISPNLKTVSVEHLYQEQIKDKYEDRNSKDQPVDLGLLSHPAYITLLRDYSTLKDQSEKLSEAKVKVEMENQRLAAENNGELYALQLETLEKTIEQLRHDLKQSTANQELLNKEYILANKERESMVMKYAISEKQLIDTQRAREYAERKVNEASKEQELLHAKLKQVQGERTRICNILDGKCHELTDAQKEVDRLKEELSMREVKLKWTQNKLKTELETHKENQQKLDKAMIRINEMKEECEQVRKESHEMIRKFQQSEENKVVTLDHQLKEQQARLILERHVTEDKELSRLQLQKEVETLKQRQHALIEENNTLSLKVQNLEKERLNYENNLSNLKVIADQRQKEIVDLVGKVSQLETLKLQLKHKEQLLSSNEAEVERLRQSNTELQSDMEWCREREAHMLEFTQKLTDKNVRLQSEFTAMEAKNEQLELEQGPLHDQIKELSSKVKALEISLASEKSKRTEECELLARHVAEQTQLARNLAQKLEDSQGENAVLRRKQQISVKEMTKELQQCKKKLDAFETGSPSNSLDRTSRTGSSSSLSTGETLNGAVSDNSNSGDHILQSVEPDRQTLIDRIVKLQRIRVRQAEKLDFLEEHTRTLVNELQKKTKIIKNYILHENPDAMGNNERDRNKAELARHGGIMASVYNQRVSDDNMTLELSLEINQKLQAVLEDTLLKNITLKDSIDTLGGEIARLTMQNKRRP